ncbi:peptidylprolyl isomerase domain and WD repeat-containing protein 1 [Bacillus rossius redtenbacheri]|uniref:peptidylprolyl isomerase domain and WD repeat-containing protein 1 n=1 Tax=Bacillus rossius redtenbacheri TaxID=93214 RepID=UPI002FDCE00E
MSEATKEKRRHEESDKDDSSDSWVGPLPSEAAKPKKKKVLAHEQLYLDHLPCAESYERSFMHRDVVTHVVVTKTEFVVTASCDGHIKFWKKVEGAIEFVKHFRSHLAPVQDLAASCSGRLLCSVSSDQSLKVFDVVNFDMINMMRLDYSPYRAEWVHSPGDAISALAVSDAGSHKVYVYDGQGSNVPLKVFDKLHTKPVVLIKYNPVFEAAVSVDQAGIVEYWTGPKTEYRFPKCARFDSKLDTDLFEFARAKTFPTGLSFSPDGKRFATLAGDRKVRVFSFLTGKLSRVLDESLQRFSELQQVRQQLPNMEFGRRMAAERDLEKSDAVGLANIVFDESGHFVMYGTMLGVKVVNLHGNKLARVLGKPENLRPLQLALYQGRARRTKAAVTVEMEASENPTLDSIQSDPTLFCTAFKKNRFYMFTRREPDDTKSQDADRDVFNEKPSKEDIISATEASGMQRLYESAVLHTTLGDVHVKLFAKECPRAVENFCVHGKNGYYNGHVFHRVIKGFMVQTGDPTGTGTGGESIWGGEFEDEFHSSLKHDRPYTLSMANAGPNTNGSQFFITLIPTPWLDNKHTVFGRVVKGMEVVQNISTAKTNPKTDKPYNDIQIVSISLK